MRIVIYFFNVTVLMFAGLHSYAQTKGQITKEEILEHEREWDTPGWVDTLTNPMTKYAWAADSGKILYTNNCVPCHGPKGKGDGVAAAGFTIKPADHTSPMVQAQTDGSLFYELSNGHAPMPAFKYILNDKQRWELVCYIRALKPKPKTH